VAQIQGGSKMSLCSSHSSHAVTLPTNLPTAAFIRRARVSILERMGSHGRDVGSGNWVEDL